MDAKDIITTAGPFQPEASVKGGQGTLGAP